MKLTLTSSLAFLLFIAVSCKKDKESGLSISGEYTVYQLVVEDPDDGPLPYPVPSPDGDYSKIIVKADADSSTSVNIYYFNKQKDTVDKASLTGRVRKVSNGDLRFVNGNNWLGTFLPNAEVEMYPSATITLYGKK